MEKKLGTPFSYVSGAIVDKNTILMLARYDDAEGASCVIKYDLVSQKTLFFDIYFNATHMCLFKDLIYVTGIDGLVVVFTIKDMYEAGTDGEDDAYFDQESIDDSENGTDTYGDIRELRLIEKSIYAVGMGRQVYRRDGKNLWSHIDQGVLDRSDNTETVHGFNSMDGYEDSLMIAAGFGGEIWRYQQAKWIQLNSPTNVILSKVKMVKDIAYICGKAGILLKVKNDCIEVTPNDETEEQLWGLEWFGESLYAATLNNIYILNQDNRLECLDMGLDSVNCGKLIAGCGLLMSVGRKDVCVTDDGHSWIDATIRYKE